MCIEEQQANNSIKQLKQKVMFGYGIFVTKIARLLNPNMHKVMKLLIKSRVIWMFAVQNTNITVSFRKIFFIYKNMCSHMYAYYSLLLLLLLLLKSTRCKSLWSYCKFISWRRTVTMGEAVGVVLSKLRIGPKYKNTAVFRIIMRNRLSMV